MRPRRMWLESYSDASLLLIQVDELDDPALRADLALCQRKGRRLPLAAEAFMEQARERIVAMSAG